MNKYSYEVVARDIKAVGIGLIVLPVFQEQTIDACWQGLNETLHQRLVSLSKRKSVTGRYNQFVTLSVEAGDQTCDVILVGCGRESRLTQGRYEKLLEKVNAKLVKKKPKKAYFGLQNASVRKGNGRWRLHQLIHSLERAAYRYNSAFDAKSVVSVGTRGSVLIPVAAKRKHKAQAEIDIACASSKGISLARNLGDLPANCCTPTYLADFASQLAEQSKNLYCKVLDETDMQTQKMGALLAVSQGSAQDAKMIVLNYQGAAETAKPYCLVGKGVTFDSGGLSIKPAGAMERMKYDMCGAAAVLGTLNAVVELKLPINLVVLIPASENLLGGSAVKPGDVVNTMSGLSVEVLNTDAEGRLLLCDALHYAIGFQPRVVIDVATLTGSCVQALGKHMHGLFSNSESLARSLLKAGESVSDLAWHMPLNKQYGRALESKVADLRNVGGEGGGAIVAASFLSRFTKRYRWAHLDVAGTATKSGVGATGRPVALLTRYLSTRKPTS